MDEKRKNAIIEALAEEYGRASCSLDYVNALHLLVSTQLSAQCTDERVNKVTPALFKRYPEAADLMNADIIELQEMIRSTGFFRNKARNIKACCKMIVEDFGGRIPDNMEDMLKLPGVGRKTANVVLGEIYEIPGIIVDTHAGRLSRRMGFTNETNPEKVEKDLMEAIPEKLWTVFSHWLVAHGRAVCGARRPLCENCVIKENCDYYRKII